MFRSLVARQFNQPHPTIQTLHPRIAVTLYTPTGTDTICTDAVALIDTGAVASVISQKFVDTHKLPTTRLLTPVHYIGFSKHITAVATHCLNTIVVLAPSEKVTKLNTSATTALCHAVEFDVVPDMTSDLILGTDVLQQINAVVNIQHRCLYICKSIDEQEQRIEHTIKFQL